MALLHELLKSNSHPLSLLAHEDLSVLGVFAPGPPFSFPPALNIVEEDPGGRGTHGVVISFVAHHKKLISLLEPDHFLDVGGLDGMLFFFGSLYLFEEIIDRRRTEEGDLVLEGYGKVETVLRELEALKGLVAVGSIGFEFDLLFDCPDDEVFSVLAGGAVGTHQEAFVGGELGVDGVGVTQQAFVFEGVAVVEMHSFMAANSQVGSLRGKHGFVDVVAKLLAASFEGRFCTFVEMVQPLEVYSFVFSDQELVPELLVDVVLP